MIEICDRCLKKLSVRKDGRLRRHWCVRPHRVETRAVLTPDGGVLRLELRGGNPLAWSYEQRRAFFAVVDCVTAFEALSQPPSSDSPQEPPA
jgi:hypothetical protein